VARNWREIRADAIAECRVDPARVDAAREDIQDAVQTHRLAEIRKGAWLCVAGGFGALMKVSQSPSIEAGERRPVAYGTRNAAVRRRRSRRASEDRRRLR
jgi:hypothetical protein